MALTKSQINTIKASINHLLDFPQEKSEFIQKESELMDALLNPVDKEHEFYWLGECLRKPTEYFRGLEQQGPGINSDNNTTLTLVTTIGEVQDTMLDHIFSCLSNTGNALSSWDKDKILSKLPTDNWNTEFKSQKAAIEGGENPWQLPTYSDRIYTQALRLNDEIPDYFVDDEPLIINQAAYVDITVACSPDKTINKSIYIETLQTNFRTDNEENRYMEEILRLAGIEAKIAAAKIAITHLNDKCSHINHHKGIVRNSNAVNEIVTNQFWFNAIEQGLVKFNQINSLTLYEAKNLLHPAIISLYKNQILDFRKAKRLTPPEMTIATHHVYTPLISNGSISINDILGITARRANLLVNPHVTNLIQREKLTFNEAKHLPYDLKEIILSGIYSSYFTTRLIDWKVFNMIPQDQSTILLNSSVARMLYNDVISLETIVNLIELHTETATTLFQLNVTAFANRLYNLCMQHPYRINGTFDTIDIIVAELTDASDICNTDIITFKEWIFYTLSNYLSHEFINRISALMTDDSRIAIYERFMNIIIPDYSQAESAWSTVFSNLCGLANEIRANIRRQEYLTLDIQTTTSLNASKDTIFSNKRKNPEPDTDIRDLCDGILACSSLNIETPQLAIVCNFK